MKFKEFIQKYKLTCAKVCMAAQISPSTFWNLMRETTRPYQTTAESIEKFTKGIVTVRELRGCDDRDEFNP